MQIIVNYKTLTHTYTPHLYPHTYPTFSHTRSNMCVCTHSYTHTHTSSPLTGEGDLFSSSHEEEEEGIMFGKCSGTGALFDNVEEEEEEGLEGRDTDLEASIRTTRSGEEMLHTFM